MEKYRVYVKVDKRGVITEVISNAFTSGDGLIEIDSGTGEKYRHAQTAYFENAIADEDGVFNYKLDGGVVKPRSEDEKSEERVLLANEREISALKSALAKTDYISAKIAEGAASAEDYSEKLAERAAWRSRINELESDVSAALEGGL